MGTVAKSFLTSFCTPVMLCIFIAACLAPIHLAYACGSMSQLAGFTLLLMVVIIPALCLVPVELALIKLLGAVSWKRAWRIYLSCLFAKGLGLVGLFSARNFGGGPGAQLLSVIAVEAAYSCIHFAVSLFVLRSVMMMEKRTAIVVAASISTLVPWVWSAAAFGILKWIT